MWNVKFDLYTFKIFIKSLKRVHYAQSKYFIIHNSYMCMTSDWIRKYVIFWFGKIGNATIFLFINFFKTCIRMLFNFDIWPSLLFMFLQKIQSVFKCYYLCYELNRRFLINMSIFYACGIIKTPLYDTYRTGKCINKTYSWVNAA
jgi:hypothetical protein